MDRHTPEQRHRNMAAIRGRDTKPEMAVRRLLFSLGYRFRVQRRDLPGRPDIVLRKYRTVIFVNGCFWHRHEGCRFASTPATRREWWQVKFEANIARDRRNYAALRELGWTVLVIWECEVKEMLRTRCIPGLPPRALPKSLPYPVVDDEPLMAAEPAPGEEA